MPTTVLSVRQLSDKHPGFSEPSLRWIIHNAHENGLQKSGALLRNGRRVLIDEAKFLEWLKSRQQRAAFGEVG